MFPWTEFHVEVQHPCLLHATRRGMETLNGGNLGMLRLKKKTASLGIPRNAVVGLAGRIYEPRFRFLRDGSSHIEGQREAALGRAEIFYRDRLHHGEVLARSEEH